MARAALHKRTPRACERCRQTRRRCETPYPCQQCVAAGVPCDVRTKARPQRRRQNRRRVSTPLSDDHRTASDGSNSSTTIPAEIDNTQPATEGPERGGSNGARRRMPRDTFELLKTLIQDMLLDRHGMGF